MNENCMAGYFRNEHFIVGNVWAHCVTPGICGRNLFGWKLFEWIPKTIYFRK